MSWLEDYTNHDDTYWVARIQRLIADNTVPREDGHGDTDLKWIRNLIDEIENSLPPDPTYDGNMRMASILSAVLGLWFVQVQNAKIHDPNRPTFTRQVASTSLLYWIRDFFLNCIDHSRHETHFPGQKWSDPWDASDRGGSFL
jgi:hypothetical protein